MNTHTQPGLTYDQRAHMALRCSSHGGPVVTSREVAAAMDAGQEMAVDCYPGRRVPLFVPVSMCGSALRGVVTVAGHASGHDFTAGEAITWHLSKGPFFGESPTLWLGDAQPGARGAAAAVARIMPGWNRTEDAVGAAELAAALNARQPVTLPAGRAGLTGDNVLWYAGDVAYAITCAAESLRYGSDTDRAVAGLLDVIRDELSTAIRAAGASGAYPVPA